ncbi:hypothetical protein VKS41_005550 [Umbelopsis sp. WA50703]
MSKAIPSVLPGNGSPEIEFEEHASAEEEDDEEEEEEEIDELQALTQRLNKEIDRSQYDPSQDKSQRRTIRQRYRELIQSAEEIKRQVAVGEADALKETMQKANELYRQVRNTQEATLDSRLLVLSADLSVQKARKMRVDYNSFDTDEFVSKVISLGGGRHLAELNNDATELNWRDIGKQAVRFGKRAVTMDFMQGPLAVEKKQRTVNRQARIVKNKEDLVTPQQLQEGDIKASENDTANNVNAIYRILYEHGPTNYFKLVTNPSSFSQTVENIFYVAFLIRNAVASIDDNSGIPIISIHDPPTADELGDGLPKKQIIMSLNMELWKEIIETFDIRESMIPTRKRSEITGGQWYG